MVTLNYLFPNFHRNIVCIVWFFIQFQYLCALQKQEDFLDEILTSYKNYREHFNLNRNHRHVRDCQPIVYGNTTFETFSKKKSETKVAAVNIQPFLKRLSSAKGDTFVYGHVVTVANPLQSLSVLEPLNKGGCQQNKRATVATSSRQLNCLVAVNAGFFNTHSGSCLGNIVSNGKLVRDSQGTQNANFGILKDGKLVTGYLSEQNVTPGNGETDFHQLVTGVLWILRNGSLYINESIEAECRDSEETGTLTKFTNVLSARTAVGHDKYGHVIIVQVDGKTNDRGMNIYDFASLLQSFGLVNAINLDGGGSATFVINQTVVNYPSNECKHYLCERKVSTILCVHDNIKCNPPDCNGHGKCMMDGHCVCDKLWTGPSCSQKECNGSSCLSNKKSLVPDYEPTCHGNSSNCSKNETTKALIKRFLMKNYAWMDALLGISLLVNLILLILVFCGNSSSNVSKKKSRFNRKDDQMSLLTANNYDDDEI